MLSYGIKMNEKEFFFELEFDGLDSSLNGVCRNEREGRVKIL